MFELVNVLQLGVESRLFDVKRYFASVVIQVDVVVVEIDGTDGSDCLLFLLVQNNFLT